MPPVSLPEPNPRSAKGGDGKREDLRDWSFIPHDVYSQGRLRGAWDRRARPIRRAPIRFGPTAVLRIIHANRFAEIRPTIICIARPKRHAPEARTRLTAFAKEHAKRERALEARAEKMRAERDKAIRAAYRDDMTMADIARVLKMSHQRVSQIVRS